MFAQTDMQKQFILERVDPDTKEGFGRLWGKIQEQCGPEISLAFCSMISNSERYYDVLFMDEEAIFDYISSLMSEDKLKIPNEEQQIQEKNEFMGKQKKSESNQYSQKSGRKNMDGNHSMIRQKAQTFKNQIVKEQRQEKKRELRNQLLLQQTGGSLNNGKKVDQKHPQFQPNIQSEKMEIQQINSSISQLSLKGQQTTNFSQRIQELPQQQFNHLQQLKKNLQKDKLFASNFSDQDFDQFDIFYQIYRNLPLLELSELPNEARQNISLDSNLDSLLNQMILVDSALYYSSPQYRLRITQILAIYCFLSKPQVGTILLQILTGEGKSTTIACLAAILTLRGRQVDIITTNNILAKRDVEEKTLFFNLLNIQVDHNIPPQTDKGNLTANKPKPCYERGTIVYGTPFSYQVDLLFDEYKKKLTRNGRPYDVAIIDEVDSMFIDQKGSQTLLSSTFAGFSDLALPMRILWQTVVMNNIIKEGEKLILYRQGERKGEIIKGQMNEVMQIIVHDIKEKFKNEIIPEWRQQFIDFSMRDWIWSAIQAYHVYKEDEHYVIKDQKIIPVDYRNTGCLQNNTEWQHGLHQFLQIKHDLQVSTESMTSNFISNIGHFCRYRKIYGLTGTLGSNESKKFLQKTYQAEMLQIPPFLERRLKIEPGYFMHSEFDWMDKILQRITEMTSKNRSVLVICQTIRFVNIIKEAIKIKNVPFKSIRCHLTGEQNHTDNVDCQEIIIATNVAGRGTDLKASKELIERGGLHVIITFMPENLRVEMQARGRAGRNGAPGSSELIANHKEYFEDIGISPIDSSTFNHMGYEQNIDFIRQQIRDKLEASAMEQDFHKVDELKTKDKVFGYFCQTVGKIPDYQTNKAKRDSLEEQWAMFLKKAQYLKFTNQELELNARKLIDSFAANSQQFYNPTHTVWRGVNEINHNNYEKANSFFKQLNAPNTTLMNKIAGRMMQSSIDIKLDDKKKKENYGSALNMMGSCLQLIEDRKDIVKGINSVGMTSNNRKIVQVMSQDKNNKAKHFLDNLKIDKIQFNPSQNINKPLNIQNIDNENIGFIEPMNINSIRIDPSQNVQRPLDNQSINNEKIDPIERRNVEKIMNIPQINVLNSLGDHIRKQIQVVQNVQPNEYVDFTFKPLSSIIDMTENKQKSIEEAFDKLAPEIPCIPVAEVKKIKVSWWKRLLVFAVGVLQICLGALIVSASAGAAASFGSFMIYSGFQDCITAIFKPQVCQDLKKFYTKKAMEYTVAIAMTGIKGMSELARLSKNGFSMITNSSMSEVLSKAMTGIKQGLAKGAFDWTAMLQKSVFMGLSSKLEGNQMIGQDVKQTFKILQKPEVKKVIQEGIVDETKNELKGKEIQEKFEQGAEKVIKKIVSEQYSRFISEMNNMKIDPNHIRIMIQNSFGESFREYFGQNNRTQTYKQMLAFVAKNLLDKDLARKVIKQFKIEQLIRKTIQNMSKSEDEGYDLNQKKSNQFQQLSNHLKLIQNQLNSPAFSDNKISKITAQIHKNNLIQKMHNIK